MENAVFIKLGAILKWLFPWIVPAAVGAGTAMVVGKKVPFWTGIGYFFFGSIGAVIIGGGIIAFFHIKEEPICGLIYWVCGLWTMAIAIHTLDQMPQLIANIREKLTK